MVQLLRREDVRRPTLLVDAEEAGTGRRRSCIGPKDSDQRTPASGVGEDPRNVRFTASGPEQGAGLAFLLDRVQRAPERLEVVGLLDEIDGPALHRLDGRIDRPFAGDHHHRGLGPNDAKTVRTSSPVAFGIRRSRRATSNVSRSTVCWAAAPSAAVTTSCPSSLRSPASSSRSVASSSATRIFIPPPLEAIAR